MEFNKLFAALLIAGILAMLAGFIARETVNVEKPEENAFKIEVTEDTGAGGPAVEAKPEPILALMKDADATKGEGVAKACAACHSFGKGEGARVGPNLYGIIGNHHAHMEGFAYSDAMTALHDKTWTMAELNVFLWNPKKHIPGTKMTFAGIKKPEQRAEVIAYLRSLADSPAALPSDAEIAAEQAELAPPVPADAEPAKADAAKPDEKADGKKADDKKTDAKKAEDKKSDAKPADAKKEPAAH